VNLISIVWLAVRRKGIGRSAALHPDCARSAKETGTDRFTRLTLFDIDRNTLTYFAGDRRIPVRLNIWFHRKKRTAFDKVGGANRGRVSRLDHENAWCYPKASGAFELSR
jgi:hypothetical protein